MSSDLEEFARVVAIESIVIVEDEAPSFGSGGVSPSATAFLSNGVQLSPSPTGTSSQTPLPMPPPQPPQVKRPLTVREFVLCGELLLFPMCVLFVDMCIVPALPRIQEQFASESTWVPWILSAYNIVGAIWTSIAGSLTDIFSAKLVTIFSFAVYIVGQIIIAAGSSNLFICIVARAIQGIGMATSTLVISMTNRSLPPHIRPLMISLTSSMLNFGMSIGLVGGGGAMQRLSWSKIFWITFPTVTVILVAFSFTLPGGFEKCSKKSSKAESQANSFVVHAPVPVNPQISQLNSGAQSDSRKGAGPLGKQKTRFRDLDFIGMGLLTVGTVCLLMGLTFSEQRGWRSGVTLGLLIFGVVVLICDVFWEKCCKRPLIPVRVLFNNRNLVMLSFMTFITGVVQFSLFQILPYLYTSVFMSYDTSNYVIVGLYMFPFGIIAVGVAFLVIKVKVYVGYQFLLLVSNLATLICVAFYIGFHNTVAQTVILNCVGGLGLGLNSLTVSNSIAVTAPKESFGAILGSNFLLRFIGGAAGPVVVTLIMQKNSAFASEAGTTNYTDESFRNAFIFLTAISAFNTVVATFLPGVFAPFTADGRKQIKETMERQKR